MIFISSAERGGCSRIIDHGDSAADADIYQEFPMKTNLLIWRASVAWYPGYLYAPYYHRATWSRGRVAPPMRVMRTPPRRKIRWRR